MQLKNNSPFVFYQPTGQIIGVFITAVVLTLVQLHTSERFLPGADTNLLYGAFLFLSVLVIYSLDHVFDLFIFEEKHAVKKSVQRIYVFVLFLAAILISFLLALYAPLLDFTHFWIPFIPCLIYAISATKIIPFIRGLKEFCISIVVAVACSYPLLSLQYTVFISFVVPAFLVCYMNLLLFSFYEKPKDDFYGFHTIYSNRDKYFAFRHLISRFVYCSMALLVGYFIIDTAIIPFLLVAIAYWLFAAFSNQFLSHPGFRWIADSILLLLLF